MLKEQIQNIVNENLSAQRKQTKKQEQSRSTRLQNLEQFIYSKLVNINKRMLKEAKHFNKYNDEVTICTIPHSSWLRGWTSKEMENIDKIMDKIKNDPMFNEFVIRVSEEMRMTHWDGSYERSCYLLAKVK